MSRRPSLAGILTKGVQNMINGLWPEKFHQIVTKTIREVTRGVINGAGYITRRSKKKRSLEEIEKKVKDRIKFYSSSAALEGAATGYGGILLGFADFPLWLSLKMKMLFDIATLYNFNVKELQERIYILHIFEITFSSQKHRNEIIRIMTNWEKEKEQTPENLRDFNWRKFQIEYRDHIDLAKLFQLIPGVGAPIGAYVNHKLTKKLGYAAMNAYRMRILK